MTAPALSPSAAASCAPAALRVLYAAGPGDVIGTFEHWKAGHDDPTSVALTYSGQFYDACRALGAIAYVIAPRNHRRIVRDGAFTFEDRPNRWMSARGVRFHLGQVWYGLRLWATALRFGADAAVVSSGTHWFVLTLLAASGVRVVPTLHCAPWPAGYRPGGKLRRAIHWLDGWFWRKAAWATICVSPECERQVREIAGGRKLRGPVHQVRAQYRRGMLDAVPPAVHGKPLRVMFAGRIERNKGVFDLLEVIDQLHRARPGGFTVEFCGGGDAERELRGEIDRRGLGGIARATGRLDAPAMREAFARAHVVVVPTTREFAEGLNKVAVEAALVGRPVITSRLANATDVLGGGVIEAPPGDVAAYRAALERLADDPGAYAAAQAARTAARPMFYDRSLGWEAAVREILSRVKAPATTDVTTPAAREKPLPGMDTDAREADAQLARAPRDRAWEGERPEPQLEPARLPASHVR